MRLDVRKMYKLFIGGAFVRSESGRSDPLWDGKAFGANIARASRKDVRDAVVAARGAQGKWSKTAPALRGLILYRLAEMMEGRREEFPQAEIDAAVDRIVWYAGWCDKYSALLSTRNPVAGPHFNFSTVEATGVVGVMAPDRPGLLGLVSVAVPALVAGNAVIAVASEKDPRTAVIFAEALATSDLPAGVINILTGRRAELGPIMAKHMDVNAIGFENDDAEQTIALTRGAADNVKRVRTWAKRSSDEWFAASAQSLDEIAQYCEVKTIWHPAGV
ncbi:MAG: aldehyde dehydrogenase family protein [Candidatus Eremiobacteraeota bacterium]|nr:aldehyde dehydrogenase family protein [Candidatus Eremiobacteraeota bacterium]